MISRSIHWILLAVLSTGLATIVFAAPPAPSLSVQTTDGQIFKLSAQRGPVVIINYWATSLLYPAPFAVLSRGRPAAQRESTWRGHGCPS